MHEHDQDLIMALAEGTLGPESAAAAEAEFGACETCREELSLQRLAMEALGAAPRASLNEFESHRIRRNLMRELGISAEPAAAPAPRRRWMPVAVLGGAAAVLLAVVLGGGALQSLRGDDPGDVAFAPITEGSDTASEDTSAPTLESTPAADTAQAVESGDAADENFGIEVPAVTPSDGAAPPVSLVSGVDDLAVLRELVVTGSGDPEETAERATALLPRFAAVPDTAGCGEATVGTVEGAVGHFVVGAGSIDGDEVVVIAYVTDPIDDSVVIAHDVVTCETVATAP